MTIIFLGTGTTSGIPVYGCSCKVCQEGRTFPFARRKQSAVLVLCNDSALLIDAGFDVSGIIDTFSIEAILLTHWHHDHYPGLFRLRWAKSRLQVYAPKEKMDPEFIKNPLNLEFHFVKGFQRLDMNPFEITTLKLHHEIETYGYLIECGDASFALLYDTKGLPENTLNFLKNKKLNVAAIDATYAPSIEDPYHNNLQEAVELGEILNAQKVILTHIDHKNLPLIEMLQYVKKRYSEKNIVAYDGLIVTTP